MLETKLTPSSFFGLLMRMRYLRRWSSKFCIDPEDVAVHSHQVAIVAHALAVIHNKTFPRAKQLDPCKIATQALYHDASELLLSDIVTPVKYANPRILAAVRELEREAEKTMFDALPDMLKESYEDILLGENIDKANKLVIKSADLVCGHHKCRTELRLGNKEFARAERWYAERLQSYAKKLPALTVFMRTCYPSFDDNLDSQMDTLKSKVSNVVELRPYRASKEKETPTK